METKTENKIKILLREIKSHKNDITKKKKKNDKNNLSRWIELGAKISSKWDTVSAQEEIVQQRKNEQ